ncbi:uncharacterized protein ATNIH1004_009888 [Aspergillus tanneri]|uniref:Uncharacterized protein n=1 Tax=Aspergillus tanneri TaxID=1220188 RepID=A0A5M9MBQ5_9EURO|nr:uncharacterized protein ATNIH1004_009888 [Aspergillus tanneri]KAA8643126.1 hypothetical protein ATNIH1004_009888 [Aspergillus tanneri]
MRVAQIKAKLFRSQTVARQPQDLVSFGTLVAGSPFAPDRQLPGGPLPTLSVTDESNIHPLFRSDSPSPAQTPTPGTIVIASSASGQTISVQTLNRVTSVHSLQAHPPRSQSPLFEQMVQPAKAEPNAKVLW